MLIEIHMIQNHSPSNLNRDDLGAPKCCRFGGVTRARISSQCIKRSIRTPGNPDDVHNREAGIFAQAMVGHIGTRTKLFPWLVQKALDEADIENRLIENGDWTKEEMETEKKAIVAACRTIARAEALAQDKEKQPKDGRQRTPQLIYVGPTQARDFVNVLLTWRNEDDKKKAECYRYFLDPATVFESLLEPELAASSLTKEQRDKALKAGWRIRNTETRLAILRELLRHLGIIDESVHDTDIQLAAEQKGQPDEDEIAKEIVRGLEELARTNEKEFGKVVSTKAAKGEPKLQTRQSEPTGFNKFVESLRRSTVKVSVDIALFGRMTTSDYFQDVEASTIVLPFLS